MGEQKSAGKRASPRLGEVQYRRAIHLLESLWVILRVLCDLSRGPRPDLRSPRKRLWRWLAVSAAGVVAAALAVSAGNLMAERLRLPLALCATLACAQTLPMALSLVRPVAAWWLSLAATIAYAWTGASLAGHNTAGLPWPWTGAALLVHLAVTLINAWQFPLRVAAAQWALSMLTGLALQTWATPPGANHNLQLYGAASVIGLALLTVVRSNVRARRQLRRQESLTALERSRRAVLEERARIARELHDVVAHHMSVVAVRAEAAPYRVADPPQELSECFTEIRENALAALAEMRHLLGTLRSDEQDPDSRYVPQPGLDNFEELLENVRSAGLDIAAEIRGVRRELPKRVELSAFRITQEALSNALRHSPGSQVEVTLTYGRSEIEVHVSNGPPAGPVEPRPGSGHGVLGMRERVSLLGGTFRATHRGDGGYEVTAALPLRSGGSEES
ncbi:sensor histidine kinase [Streptomyces benahoarensis]|uniref:histidine kinase n=2 Tax=Streptomyces benahoarensis TaxID=2595054 RepID=A0A553ZQI1_9ACTN|nr:sensor histidine kinase [Streptomyces benahoarensis]TSB43645.1 sensor histidine kinase [Streptomyces benahoarensis]